MARVLLRNLGSRLETSNNLISTLTDCVCTMQRRGVMIPSVESLSTAGATSWDRSSSPSSSSSSSSVAAAAAAGPGGGRGSTSYRFAVKDGERGLYDHGITPEARALMAEAEAQYKLSADNLHAVAGGVRAPELRTNADGAVVSCVAAPFGEEYVPSHRERFAHRGHVGELSMQRAAEPKYLLNAHAELNLRKERQLRELLSSPMPLLQKAREVKLLLPDFYTQRLTVSSRNVEAIVAMWAQCSVEMRLAGDAMLPKLTDVPSETAPSEARVGPTGAVPFLSEMKQLYFHARQTHVAPTPLVLESLMLTLSSLTMHDKNAFHLANRLLLDADKYVVLPTRTTYAAFFTICNLHNAMPFAMARFKDAVVHLHIAADSVMVTALLKGLCQNGFVEEAVALLARVEHVPLDVQLLNASLEVLLLSWQPQACFSAFDAMRCSAVRPTAETYTYLLLACERSGMWCRSTAILADMQSRRVKGDSRTLNLLLKGLLTERLHSYARQLYEAMVAKNVEVWPALQSHMNPSRAKRSAGRSRDRRSQLKE